MARIIVGIKTVTIKIYPQRENRLFEHQLREASSKPLILTILMKKNRDLMEIVLFLNLLLEIVKEDAYQIKVLKTII
jgi:hypothetical protein